MVYSMTAFAKQTFNIDNLELVMTMRSVNHRFFDLNLKLPEALQIFEWKIRNLLRSELKRGKVDFTINLNKAQNGNHFVMDLEFLKVLKENSDVLEKFFPNLQVEFTRFINLPGLIKREDTVFVEEEILAQCLGVIQNLKVMQRTEGDHLVKFLKVRLNKIKEIVRQIGLIAEQSILDYRNHLKKQVFNLVQETDVNAKLLEQSVLYFAEKSDITEELDRLKAHIKAVHTILDSNVNEEVGKKLDFLMQEFNREANTLASKAANLEITEAALELKLLIEQMREQVQNIL